MSKAAKKLCTGFIDKIIAAKTDTEKDDSKTGSGPRPKWRFLQHRGPWFPPPPRRLPPAVRLRYAGRPLRLSPRAEEAATFFARLHAAPNARRHVFRRNFLEDWRAVMTDKERAVIRDLDKCDFFEISQFLEQERKEVTKEMRQRRKQEALAIQEKYGTCLLDHREERIGNFRVEPPGIFMGRGDHPRAGRLKPRVLPEHVTINCSRDALRPRPPPGHRWRRVQHDPHVTWLAAWPDALMGGTKYVWLGAASAVKTGSDFAKFELARKLHTRVDEIRSSYRRDLKSSDPKTSQLAVALYFIDTLSLRAGNEKSKSSTADTVGCCSLRVEHIKLRSRKGGHNNVVEFDFLGKDSIRYQNSVPVDSRVYQNLVRFTRHKSDKDLLFDQLCTNTVNKHLSEKMEGLTAKVFRTYNASRTLSAQLDKMTVPDSSLEAKLLVYNRANRRVAVICNHQKDVSKNHASAMAGAKDKIRTKEQQLERVSADARAIQAEYKKLRSDGMKTKYERSVKRLKALRDHLSKLKLQATDKEENKNIALGTSKLNYLDPRISVAWCRKHAVPIEKIYNKTQRERFKWALNKNLNSFKFC